MMTSAELHEAARNTYPSPHYLYLKEVRDATGFDGVRTADGMAIGMYSSRGHKIHGFEMKVSRSDWLREMKNPAKAESMFRFCHHWSVITPGNDVTAPPQIIIKREELPAGWGWGVWTQSRKNAGARIKWVVEPPALTPQPMSMQFVTAVLYAATKEASKPTAEALGEQYRSGIEQGKSECERTHRNGPDDRLRKIVDEFEKASGVRLDRYTMDAKKMGATFQEYLNAEGNLARFKSEITWVGENVERILDGIKGGIKRIDEGRK